MTPTQVQTLYARVLFDIAGAEDVIERLRTIGDERSVLDVGPESRREELLSYLAGLIARNHGVPPDTTRAGMIVAHDVALSILSGETSPYEGARAIWINVTTRAPELRDSLREFVGLASEWEDDPKSRHEYEEQIRAAAKELVARVEL